MILVSGAGGLLGSHLLLQLAKKGLKIRAMATGKSGVERARKTFSYYHESDSALFDLMEWKLGDINDIGFLHEALEEVTQVYHCAGIVSFSPNDQELIEAVNVKGTENMVNACLEKGIDKFLHVSSVAALGKATDGTLTDENSWFNFALKPSYYGVSKYNAEREVWRAYAEGLPVVIVNPSVILGPGNWEKGSSKMFGEAYRGMRFFTEGSTGFIDVRDAAQIMIRLMESDIEGERFILNSVNAAYREVFDLMHDCFKRPRPSIKATKLMAELLWRWEYIYSRFSGKPPLITKETAKAAFEQIYYCNNKLIKSVNYSFIPLQKSINDFSVIFTNQFSNK